MGGGVDTNPNPFGALLCFNRAFLTALLLALKSFLEVSKKTLGEGRKSQGDFYNVQIRADIFLRAGFPWSTNGFFRENSLKDMGTTIQY